MPADATVTNTKCTVVNVHYRQLPLHLHGRIHHRSERHYPQQRIQRTGSLAGGRGTRANTSSTPQRW